MMFDIIKFIYHRCIFIIICILIFYNTSFTNNYKEAIEPIEPIINNEISYISIRGTAKLIDLIEKKKLNNSIEDDYNVDIKLTINESINESHKENKNNSIRYYILNAFDFV